MRLLAIDTALGACQAALLDGDHVLAARSEAMARGHQERLAPMVAELMAAPSSSSPPQTLAGGRRGEEKASASAFAALDRIAVTVGPGSFTGLRVGLAFAKGLGVALDRPVLGVGTLAALAASRDTAGVSVALVDAGRGRVYLQAFAEGAALAEPQTLPLVEAAALLKALAPRWLVGPGAPLLADACAAEALAMDAPDPAAVGRLAASLAPEAAPPRPLYLREPDAKTLVERRAAAAPA